MSQQTSSKTPPRLNPLAQELNAELARAAPEILQMLSALGRRLYFPRGILSQSAEAKTRGQRFNATIGIATEGGEAMHLASVQRHLADIAPDDIYPYAGAGGRLGLRRRWQEKQLAENPSLRGKAIGLPIVTSALTHGLSLVGDLFVDAGDVIVLPDKLWGNYRLTYEVRLGACMETFPFYAGPSFNVPGLAQTLEAQAQDHEKLIVLLNFPNNPTGYMPSEPEGQAIADVLVAQARKGTKLLVVCDDAYFGLFYHLGGRSLTESLFGLLANRHANLLALRLDGATKELFAWGLRCGFLTFGTGRAETAEKALSALDAKTRGAIRGGVSNAPMLSQTLVERALLSSSIDEERKQKREILRARAERVHQVANAPRFRESFEVYPFNSGYFMCLRVKGVTAEQLRVHLLDAYGAGLVASGEKDLRIAFSCLEIEQIEPLFEVIHKGIQELREA